ncbi:MAG: hypothetical protein FWD13_09420 [Treponema sp.]|nr:hypothetical protein [Treponema sp.]
MYILLVMFAFSRRFIYALSNKIWRKNPEYYPEEKYTIDFAKKKKSPFIIKSESSYNANLSNGAFELGLKKSNCIAWVDIPDREYQNHIIEAKIRLDSLGGYAAAGIVFHIMDEDSYYMALVSSKGYFRMDVVKNGTPKTLIAWTEISDFNGTNIGLNIITYGTDIIVLVNGKWLGEINDDSLAYGRLGFTLASYEGISYEETSYEGKSHTEDENQYPENTEAEYSCKAYLDYISVDTRIKVIENNFKQWTNDSNINADCRLRLAETFAVMGENTKALEQINRAWKRRDDVIRSISSSSEIRTKRELLLAARLSFRLGQYDETEEFLTSILDQWPNSDEGKLAFTEKMKVLGEQNKFTELKNFVIKNPIKVNKDIDYYTLLARCHWELKDYAESAKAWSKAYEINKENGVYAANAANAYELSDNGKDALTCYIRAGKIFLNQDNTAELAAIMPKLALLGSKNWEARALMGKWAFSIEDYSKSAQEFEAADKLRCAMKPRPKPDPAIYYLWGLVFYIKGKKKTAISLLEKAVKLAPDYELFRTKLEELKNKTR